MSFNPPAIRFTPMTKNQRQLKDQELQIVEEEQVILQRVASTLAEKMAQQEEEQKKRVVQADYTKDLIELRDQVAEARLEDVPALVSQMLQAAALASEAKPTQQGSVDMRSPYFGHLKLKEDGRERDVLIGKGGAIQREAGVVIVDWRHAPISQLYYKLDEGDDYEEIYGGQERTGEVLARRTVTIKEGNLQRIRCPQGHFLKNDNQWDALDQLFNYQMRGGAGISAPPKQPRRGSRKNSRFGIGDAFTKESSGQLEEITALIDPKQFESMTQSDSGLMILQGGAGSGKTTIALHRIAWLAYNYPEKYRPKRIRVIVYSEALVRYVRRVLPALGLPNIKVASFHRWAHNLCQRVVDFTHYRFQRDVEDEVAILKKHPGMLQAIRSQIQRQKNEIENSVLAEIKQDDLRQQLQSPIHQIIEGPAWVPALIRLKKLLVQHQQLSSFEKTRIKKKIDAMIETTSHLESQWEELITDSELLSPLMTGPNAISKSDFDSAMRWTKNQISEPDDQDADLDAKTPIDDYSEDLPHGKLDPYDAALFLNMVIERSGYVRSIEGRPITLDHVSVDEAQDLSPVELRPLHVMTAPNHSLTLAGDTKQKMFFDNGCNSWRDLVEPVGGQAQTVETFRLIYRSTAPIAGFAHEVLGPLAPESPPKTIKDGAPVCVFPFDEQGEEIAFLAEQLRELMNHEPFANVCLLTRYPEQARLYFNQLQRCDVPGLRLQDGPDFRFTPGIDVTHLRWVKGLEYDYVIMTNVDRASYPNDVETRHLLHIGATRAAHQLWITTNLKNPSPLLPEKYFVTDAY
ncbi:MAG: hypothetical protein CMH56_08545 [Myxococcales bacterium]|nr:hypothetical protein [Myxococcales bacterium]